MIRSSVPVLLLLLVIQSTPGMAGSGIVRGELGEKLDEYMTQLSTLGYSGALLVAKDGDVVLSKGYGMADRERGIPFTNKTVFTIGSIEPSPSHRRSHGDRR